MTLGAEEGGTKVSEAGRGVRNPAGQSHALTQGEAQPGVSRSRMEPGVPAVLAALSKPRCLSPEQTLHLGGVSLACDHIVHYSRPGVFSRL